MLLIHDRALHDGPTPGRQPPPVRPDIDVPGGDPGRVRRLAESQHGGRLRCTHEAYIVGPSLGAARDGKGERYASDCHASHRTSPSPYVTSPPAATFHARIWFEWYEVRSPRASMNC